MAISHAVLARLAFLCVLAPAVSAQLSPNWLPTFGEHPGSASPVKALAAVHTPGPQSRRVLAASSISVGAVASNALAGWDGSRWLAMTPSIVPLWNSALNHDFGQGRELVIAGDFSDVGTVSASRVARFDGVQWRAIGNGVPGTANSLATFSDGLGSTPSLYVGGSGFSPGSQALQGIRRFDGIGWASVGGGLGGTAEVLKVLDLGAGPRLFVGGSFLSAGGVPNTRGIAVWDGTTWSALGAGIAGTVYDIELHDEGNGPRLFVAGDFLNSGAPFVTGVARFNGGTWEDVGYGVGGPARALRSFSSGGTRSLFVGGDFVSAGLTLAKRIARWDGTQWHDFGGANLIVRRMERFDAGDGSGEKLYVAGDFTSLGGVGRDRVAVWDGTQWSNAGGGVSDTVEFTAFWDGGTGGTPKLYVAGAIESSPSAALGNVQRWSGSAWESVGFDSFAAPEAILPFDDGSGPALYVGGDFDQAAGVAAAGIVRLRTGGTWEPVGGGLQGRVRTLAVFDSGSGPQLYAGGDHDLLSAYPGSCIARWNGTQWIGLPTQAVDTQEVWVLQSYDDGNGAQLYAGGRFLSLAGVNSPRLVRWNGTAFSPVGTGLTETCAGLDLFRFPGAAREELIVTGNFISASGTPANRVAVWNGTTFRALSPQLLSAQALGAVGFDDGTGAGEQLYVYGSFTTISGVACRGIARFDGSTLLPLGTGTLIGSVFSAAVWSEPSEPDRLVVTGNFRVSPSRDSYVALWGSATDAIESYCTAGTSTNGCQAQLSAIGVAQVDPATTFRILASGVEGARAGMIHFGTRGRIATPFKPTSSSVLCVRGPVQRTQAQLSGGNAGSCDGTLELDWRSYMDSNAAALGLPLFAGEKFNAQGWYRDPAAPGGASLSDALEFEVLP